MLVEAPTTANAAAPSSNDCPKCATNKKSGTHSCCARGGSWFNKCGDISDPKFDHTWSEGVEACKGTLARFCYVVVRHMSC